MDAPRQSVKDVVKDATSPLETRGERYPEGGAVASDLRGRHPTERDVARDSTRPNEHKPPDARG